VAEANGLLTQIPVMFVSPGIKKRGPSPVKPIRYDHGSTITFACCSGSANSSKAPFTPSSPTCPVIRGVASIRPSAMWASLACYARPDLSPGVARAFCCYPRLTLSPRIYAMRNDDRLQRWGELEAAGAATRSCSEGA
jgi:hypothetical protein